MPARASVAREPPSREGAASREVEGEGEGEGEGEAASVVTASCLTFIFKTSQDTAWSAAPVVLEAGGGGP